MKMENLQHYIEKYLNEWEYISRLESYKWNAFRHFSDYYNRKYDHFNAKICKSFEKAGNLLSSGQYYAFDRLKKFSDKTDGCPTEFEVLFNNLLQPNIPPTVDRVRDFINGAKNILREMKTDLKNAYQDAHAVSVYLSMFYPNDFYIYKYGIFKEFSRIVNFSITCNDNAVDRLFEYQTLCNEVKKELKKNTKLIQFYKQWLKQYDYTDDEFNLLTQDFIYAVATYLNRDTQKIGGNRVRVKGNVKVIKTRELNNSKILSTKSKLARGNNKVNRKVDYSSIYEQNQKLGYRGELWVINYEEERLRKKGINAFVKHVAKDSDDAGYDIESVEDDGKTPRYIEVKTTSGKESTPIYFTEHERLVSRKLENHYYIYRVYNFKDFYNPASLTIIEGSFDDIQNKKCVLYEATIQCK